jgi:SAM-dependent methyltransferase
VNRNIRTIEDVLSLLDGLFAPDADRWTEAGGADWWDTFYADRSRGVPFFVDKPDESLVAHVTNGQLAPGRALDVGCGAGRNARYLASVGFDVDAVDLSPTAITWARELARGASASEPRSLRAVHGGAELARGASASEPRSPVRFHCADVFTVDSGPYQLVYDSGCFHHLPPHRRVSYLALLDRCLAPGGYFGLSCFAAGAMGSELADAELYRHSRLDGGLAYTPEELRWIFAELDEVELRRMRDEPADSPYFGEPFLWTALLRRPS